MKRACIHIDEEKNWLDDQVYCMFVDDFVSTRICLLCRRYERDTGIHTDK